MRTEVCAPRSCEIESFEGLNDGRFAIAPVAASLNEATAPAAEGYKVVCTFVNDTCDAQRELPGVVNLSDK